MKANELRIGNLVLLPCEGHEDELVSINKYDFEEPYNFKPIPLTEEILLKAGFEKIKSRHDYFILSSYDQYNPTPEGCRVNVYFDFDGVRVYYAFESDGARMIRRIHFVHQLQNLYYALTGEELEIDLNK